MAMASVNVLCMNPEDRETSYANNSSVQKNILLKTRPFLEDTIKDMLSKILPGTCIKVADLGCASAYAIKCYIPCTYFFENDLFDWQGLVQESDVDSFNLPYYTPCKEEMREIIKKEGSFNLDKMEVFEVNWDFEDNDYNENYVFEKNKSGQNFAKIIRAATESILNNHFGEIVINDLFTRYALHVGEHLSRERTKYTIFVVLMTMN
ncbi:hypothetical protein like AT5G04370 [Hibiscus trionum]|uniref:Uncharacterized protein n=1 Tax=Hibiscus trionum TaxID=183268 RepID=A0A9W7M3B3_HIBTR|nr:hypothetical protein like AT5G04370 [Hibiscus trionum]